MSDADQKPVQRLRVPDSLNPKQKAFCRAYLENGGDPIKAAIEAGYSERSASACVQRLMANPKVAGYLGRVFQKAEQKAEVDAEYLIKRAQEVLERCMGDVRPVMRNGEPVMVETEDGEVVPAYQFDAANSLKAIQLLGSWSKLRMWSDRVEHTGPGGGPIGVITTEVSEERAAEIYRDLVHR